jgi:acetylornithine deacetylase/succinyl-diaminopimelate desuccinylase-like protein
MFRHSFWLAVVPVLICGALAAPARAQQPPTPVDWPKLSEEATGWLVGLVKMDTSNPPGNELAAAKYLAEILEREGIHAEVIETAPERGIVIARLQAGALPDPSRALLLMAHTDVVGVQKEKWSVDPFGGIIKDGYLYGRGTIDDKGAVIANLAVMVALKRAGARLNRDVIFLAESDEEARGDLGIQVAIQKYWDKIAAGYALNEEGRVIARGGKVQYVAVQTTEKISLNVLMTATGTSGHASMPRPDNPIVHLAAAVAKIGAYEAPVNLTVVTRAYFEQLAQVADPEIGKWMRALETPERMDHAARVLSDASPMWNSMLRDTIAPTIFRAGFRHNVVPSEAQATLNIRLLPGDSIQALIEQMQKLGNDPQVRFELEKQPGPPPPPSSLDSELYQTIERIVPLEFPGAVVAPMISTGATDSAPLRLHGVQAYGLLPFPLAEEDVRRMHADDERIPLDSFHKGIEFLYRVVDAFAVAR